MCIRMVVFAFLVAGGVLCSSGDCSAQGYPFVPTSRDCGCHDWGTCRPGIRLEPRPFGGCGAGGCGDPVGFGSPMPRSIPRSNPEFPYNQSPYYPEDTQPGNRQPLPGSRNFVPPSRDLGEVTAPQIPSGMEGIGELPAAAEQAAALQQRICPVTQELLGSMGKPIRVNVNGRAIFVCCEGCVQAVQRNPNRYLKSSLRPRSMTVRAF